VVVCANIDELQYAITDGLSIVTQLNQLGFYVEVIICTARSDPKDLLARIELAITNMRLKATSGAWSLTNGKQVGQMIFAFSGHGVIVNGELKLKIGAEAYLTVKPSHFRLPANIISYYLVIFDNCNGYVK